MNTMSPLSAISGHRGKLSKKQWPLIEINSRGLYSPPFLSKGYKVNWVEQANVSASRAH
jgi:hypothetical protein